MVRNYRRKFTNSRNGKNFSPYVSYSVKDLEKAIAKIQNGTLKVTEASERYNIPSSTLSRKSRNKNCSQGRAGHPTLLSEKEEIAFLKYLKLLNSWGFPLDCVLLRLFAQSFLDELEKPPRGPNDNLPGEEWARNFLKRHKKNIFTKQMPGVSSDCVKVMGVLDLFFKRYEKAARGVSPDCLVSFYETKLTDDPGNKNYLIRRTRKYPERFMKEIDMSTGVSVTFTGTANGQLLPMYVVYQASHLRDQWTTGGPPGTRYNHSLSGWSNTNSFEDWFYTIIVPFTKTKGGRKVAIIGDNLSSHFSLSVLQTCQELNIIFVCLPSKSAGLLQPLESIYTLLKKYWPDVITQWKCKLHTHRSTLMKRSFPLLLCNLHNKLTEETANSIIVGFCLSGLHPINSEQPMERLSQNMNSKEQRQDMECISKEIFQDITYAVKSEMSECVLPVHSIDSGDEGLEEIHRIQSLHYLQTEVKNEESNFLLHGEEQEYDTIIGLDDSFHRLNPLEGSSKQPSFQHNYINIKEECVEDYVQTSRLNKKYIQSEDDIPISTSKRDYFNDSQEIVILFVD